MSQDYTDDQVAILNAIRQERNNFVEQLEFLKRAVHLEPTLFDRLVDTLIAQHRS